MNRLKLYRFEKRFSLFELELSSMVPRWKILAYEDNNEDHLTQEEKEKISKVLGMPIGTVFPLSKKETP
jgi:hypothetical protein